MAKGPAVVLLDTLSSVLPPAIILSDLTKVITGKASAVGRVSIEIELLDSLSGARLAAAIDRREDGKQIVSGKWTDIKEAFEHWAQNLRVWLDKERAKSF